MRVIILALLVCSHVQALSFINQDSRVTSAIQTSVSSMSNSTMPAELLTCPTSYEYVRVITATLKSATGKVSTCQSVNRNTCITAGDTTLDTAIVVNEGNIVILGIDSMGNYNPTEVTTATKFDGDFDFEKICVSKDKLR